MAPSRWEGQYLVYNSLALILYGTRHAIELERSLFKDSDKMDNALDHLTQQTSSINEAAYPKRFATVKYI